MLNLPKIHKLKIQPKFLNEIKTKKKTFELRKNDRNFQLGDMLMLVSFKNNEFQEDGIMTEVVYVLNNFGGLQEGYVILGIDVTEQHKSFPIDWKFYKNLDEESINDLIGGMINLVKKFLPT